MGIKSSLSALLLSIVSVCCVSTDKTFFKAVIKGDIEQLDKLLGRGFKIDTTRPGSDDSEQALHYAAKYGKKEVVQFLLSKGADLNAADRYQRTPLYYAVVNRNSAIMQSLIDLKANLNRKDIYAVSALHYAAENGYVPEMELLINAGADIDVKNKDQRTPLHIAIVKQQPEAAMLLIARGASLTAGDEDGTSPLHLICREGNPELLKHALSRKADINIKDHSGYQPMHYAAALGRLAVIRELLAVNATVPADLYYLETTSRTGTDTVSTKGIKQSPGNIKHGTRSPLRIKKNTAVIKQTSFSEEAVPFIIFLAKKNEPALAEELLAKGLKAEASDESGRSALVYAKSDEMKSLLKKYGAK